MVRIVENFWENYETYKLDIRKSVIHILRQKYNNRDTEYEREAISIVILELHRLEIFKKWNQKRLDSETTNTERQFGLYLYQRIWSIINNICAQKFKDNYRYRNIEHIEIIHPKTWVTPPGLYADNKDVNLISDPVEKEKEIEVQHYRASRHPTISEIGDILTLPENPYDSLEAEDAWNKLMSICKNNRERKIIQYRKEGFNSSQISEMLNTSISYVSMILKQLKKRFEKYLELA